MAVENGGLPPVSPAKQALRNLLVPFGKTRIGGWMILKWITPIDHFLMKLTKGRFSIIETTYPSLLLTTIGAKTGQPRSVPLIYLIDNGNYVLIASAAGQERHPGWYYNLRANPKATVLMNGETFAVTAREATEEERARIWPRATNYYTGYAVYERRASHRQIGIFILTRDS